MKKVSKTETTMSFEEVVSVLTQALQLPADSIVLFTDKDKKSTAFVSGVTITSNEVVDEFDVVGSSEEEDEAVAA